MPHTQATWGRHLDLDNRGVERKVARTSSILSIDYHHIHMSSGPSHPESNALLLDEEDGITEQVRIHSSGIYSARTHVHAQEKIQFEACLGHIFAKFCTPPPRPPSPDAVTGGEGGGRLSCPPDGAYLSAEGLDEWARATNGAPLSGEEKEEIVEYMDVTEGGCLT